LLFAVNIPKRKSLKVILYPSRYYFFQASFAITAG